MRDSQFHTVQVHRYRYCSCHRTIRHYPPGVDRADQSQRLRKLVALCWVLGLSYRGIALVLAAFGVKLSAMSAWRDGQELAEQKKRHRAYSGEIDQ